MKFRFIKSIFLFTILLITQSIISQEELLDFKNSLNPKSRSEIKSVIPIVNDKSNDISLFLVHAKNIYGYLINDKFEVINKISSEDRSRKYKVILGNSISDSNDYRIYLTNKNHTKFATINFSYSNQKTDFKELDLNFEKELFVQTVTDNNKFYILTIDKKTSLFNIYSFDDEGNYKKNKLDFSKFNFKNYKNEEVSLYNLFFERSGFGKIFNLFKIDLDNPNSIENTAELNKMFVKNNEVLFSFDENKEFTQLIFIKLSDFDIGFRKFQKPLKSISSHRKKTNSFIGKENIYLISSTPDEFSFEIRNFNSETLLKKYDLSVNDSIYFKNTPIIQKGGMYKSYREMEKTRKFLRKITNGEIGISSYNYKGNYYIIIGGKEVIRQNAPMMMPIGGLVPVAVMGGISIFFNPTYTAFNSYTETKSTRIKGYFDKNYNHISGEMPKNAFDKIYDFKEKKASKNGRTIFKYKDYFILGNSFFWQDNYKLRKFTDWYNS